MEAGDEAKREEQLTAYFELKAIQMGEEGLVVKTLDGHYEVCIPSALCDTFSSNDQVKQRLDSKKRIYGYIWSSHKDSGVMETADRGKEQEEVSLGEDEAGVLGPDVGFGLYHPRSGFCSRADAFGPPVQVLSRSGGTYDGW